MSTEALVNKELPRITELRHALHRIPELGYQEFKTAAMIREQLDKLGIEYVAGVTDAPTATIAWIGDTSKPCVALRADIDALPIIEQTGVEYSSTHEGRMHACGHDGHTAILSGVAGVIKSIAALEHELPCCVKLIWQPAEEGGGGAAKLVKAGVLDGRLGPKVSSIFGLHGWPGMRVGLVATKGGPLLAATDSFTARFVGRGCHGAFPHLGRDPIVTACEAVLNLQQFASREIDPTEPVVITVGTFNAGTAVNIIPDHATINGTARTLTPTARKNIAASVQRRCEGIAKANDCRLEFTWTEGYPATINDNASADYVAQIAKQTFGAERYVPVGGPSMGGEDFAYYLQQVPGCFFLVGVATPQRDPYPPLHSDQYDFTDSALAVGLRMFVELCRNYRPR